MLLVAFTDILPFLLSLRTRGHAGLWGSAECLESCFKCWVWQSTCYALPSSFPHHFKPLCISKEILPTCPDLFTPKSSKCHLEKATIWCFKSPIAFFLSLSSCNQCVLFGHTKQIQVLFGKQADEGTSLCLKKLSSVFWRLFLYLTSRSSSVSLFCPEFYFVVSLI